MNLATPAGSPPPEDPEWLTRATFWLVQAFLLAAAVLGSCACGSTTELALDVAAYVAPAASSPTCAGGTISAAGWCCVTAPVPLCTPTADAFADGLSLPVDSTDAPMVKP